MCVARTRCLSVAIAGLVGVIGHLLATIAGITGAHTPLPWCNGVRLPQSEDIISYSV